MNIDTGATLSKPNRGDAFEAIILAGGLGTRLRSVVGDVPKVLAPVAGRPFIEHVLGRLHRAGCVRVVLAVGYRREQVMQAVGQSFAGMPIAYSVEESPLGTGGAILLALTKSASPQALVMNGDTWIELDYAALLHAHRSTTAQVSVAVTHVDDVARYGAVDIDGDRRVVRFSEKGEHKAGFINGGVYAVAPDGFSPYKLPAAFSFEQDFLARHCAALRPLAFLSDGPFIDIGVPDDYARAQDLLRERADA